MPKEGFFLDFKQSMRLGTLVALLKSEMNLIGQGSYLKAEIQFPGDAAS